MSQVEKASQTSERLPRPFAARKLPVLLFVLAAILSFGKCGDEKTITGPVAARSDASVTETASSGDRQVSHSGVKPRRTPKATETPRPAQTPTPTLNPPLTRTDKPSRTPKESSTPTPTPTPAPTTYNVRVAFTSLTGWIFSPAVLHVHRGDTVRWQRLVFSPIHSSTSGTCSSTVSGETCQPDGNWDGSLGFSRSSFSKTFSQSGTFPYFCKIGHIQSGRLYHEKGTIIVDP